ncbi:hypothetical protein [Dyadobacter crusticola]|uniref:hypothetical protein n=1 Tax=Dyadobacter crusticola TaxID=292407 RepID=UPI0004E1F825|nr:hypothetical protein [Dyadobacter crusticola]
MNLIQIIALYKSGKLPAHPAVLRSCEAVLEHASSIAFAAWRTTSNPVTAKMLEKEQIRYETILKQIRKMQLANASKAQRRRAVSIISPALHQLHQ